MTASDEDQDSRPISVAELLARNGIIGSPPVGGHRRRRRGKRSGGVSVSELTGEIPVIPAEEIPAEADAADETVESQETAGEQADSADAGELVEAEAVDDVDDVDDVADVAEGEAVAEAEAVDEAGDVEYIAVAESVDEADEAEDIDEADEAEDIEVADEAEDIEVADEAEDIEVADEAEDIDEADEAEDIEVADEAEDIEVAEAVEEAESARGIVESSPRPSAVPPRANDPRPRRGAGPELSDDPRPRRRPSDAERMAFDPVDESVDLAELIGEQAVAEDLAEAEALRPYLTSTGGPLFSGETIADDIARRSGPVESGAVAVAEREARPARRIESRLAAVRHGAVAVLQSIAAVAFGAGLFIGFDQLWRWNTIVALVLSVLVILGLVIAVRVVRRTEDIASTLIAVAVGALVTLGPLALLQST